tara:strand:- start:8672 stop:8902 length:231 start_codon:yes stop_codon:yes gene_type:complete
MATIQKLLLINNLPLPFDLTEIIRVNLKYDLLEKKYKSNMTDVLDYLKYYEFLRIKLNRKYKTRDSLLKVIKTYEI